MKATIQTQGRQFTVSIGDVLKVNSFPGKEESFLPMKPQFIQFSRKPKEKTKKLVTSYFNLLSGKLNQGSKGISLTHKDPNNKKNGNTIKLKFRLGESES